ncbi:hypothetical protein GPA22_11855 [Aromatoleum toluvorans]|uniref:Uncharacterized protein n=1 Tax=Aromatoleum toluvorans TaxID=92002 RepID=A0ABX1Q0G0_9RHOO|nr:hypothetical protein [Aromatoleum toluvorans]NMG44422.1 hypothetical protein [Aromatoleum toluvorans]
MTTDNASPDYLEKARSLPAEESARLLQRFGVYCSKNFRLRSLATTEKMAHLLCKADEDLAAWRTNLAALRQHDGL